MGRIKYAFLLFIFGLFLVPEVVSARVEQFNVCFGDDGLYSITYDTDRNSEVSLSKITLDAARNGHLPYPNGIEDERYKFTSAKIDSRCYNDGGEARTCPSNSEIDYNKIHDTYYNGAEAKITSNVKIDLNESTGMFDIRLKDNFNGKLNIRFVRPGMEENDGVNSADAYAGQLLGKSGNDYVIYGVAGDTAIKLEFYENISGSCNGAYIGTVTFFTPSVGNFEIANPAKANPNAYGCNLVREYLPQGMTNTDDISKLDGLKRDMVRECYNEKIMFSERANLANTITERFNALKNLFAGYSTNINSKNTSVCNDKYSTSRITYSRSGSYWAIVCTETYTAQGDIPKLVKAGAGFSYQANYTISRSCNITQIRRPSRKPQCSASTSCDCSYKYNGQMYYHETEAGPNDEFDKCVNTCDGGKYTQNCINTCYSKVYGNKRNTNFTNKFSIESKNSNIKFMADEPGVSYDVPASSLQPSGRGTSSKGYPGNLYELNGTSCFVSDACNRGGYGCTFHVSVGPSGCSWDPEGDYRAELAASASELSSMAAYQGSAIPLGNYTYNITDTYLKGTDGRPYVWTVNSTSNPAVSVVGGNQVYSNVTRTTAPLGNSGGGNATYSPSANKSVNITVSLPLSYVNKITGKVGYSTTGGSSDSFQVAYTESGYAKTRLQQITGFNSVAYYHENGERKYYTDIHSKDTNVTYQNGKPVLFRTTPYNIVVTSNNVGGGNFSSNIDCYYGVYNEYYNYECDTHCDPKKEICDCGIQYIFRPIVLEDVFPNAREPRFNWSSRAVQQANESLYGIKVDPVALTKEIERKGQRIYETSSGETDYVFILTADNIKSIKNYNSHVEDFNGDKDRNYLDYDMKCFKNGDGREICTSRFLDNTEYVKYGSGYNAEQRRSIAGCNNANQNGTRCDTSIK